MCPNLQFPVDLVRFTELNLNGKLQLLCVVSPGNMVAVLIWFTGTLQPILTCSKSTMKTVEKGVDYVQS